MKLTYSYVVRNIRIGSTAAQNVNSTKYPQVFFKSLRDLIVTTENLVKIEPFWRFDGRGPSEQLEDLNNINLLSLIYFCSFYHIQLIPSTIYHLL